MLQKAEEGEEESGTVQLMMMPYFGSSLSAFLRLLFPLFFSLQDMYMHLSSSTKTIPYSAFYCFY